MIGPSLSPDGSIIPCIPCGGGRTIAAAGPTMDLKQRECICYLRLRDLRFNQLHIFHT